MSANARLLFFLTFMVVIGGAGLWITGGKKADYSTSIEINATPQQVFPFLVEPDLMVGWIDGLKQVGPLIPDENDNRPSSETRTPRVLEKDGRTIRFEDQVIRFQPDESISIQSFNATRRLTTTYQLEQKSASMTKVKIRVHDSNLGLGRLLAHVTDFAVQDQIEDEALKLKALVENQTVGSSTVEQAKDNASSDQSLYRPPMFDQPMEQVDSPLLQTDKN